MKHTFLLIFFYSAIRVSGQTETKYFLNKVDSFRLIATFTNSDVVSQKTFNSYLDNAFRKQILGFSGDVPQGSSFGLELNEEKTNAVAQFSYRFKDGDKKIFKNVILGLGFTASIENNSFQLYSGKDGFGTDFSVDLPLTKIFKSSLFYDGSSRIAYVNKRNLYIAKLVESEGYFFNQYQYYYDAMIARSTPTTDFSINKGETYQKSQETDDLLSLNDESDTMHKHFERIFGTEKLTRDETIDAITTYVEDKISEFETKSDMITGYSFWQMTFKPTYTSKTYLTFNDTLFSTDLSKKFGEELLNYFGGSFILSKFKNTAHFYKNFNLDLSYVKESSFDQAENIQYKRNYVTNVTQYGDSTQTLYSTKTKEAFDLKNVQYKKNDITSLTLSYSILGTKSKNFGLYGYAKGSYSALYTNNQKIDLGVGPIFAIVADDKNSSKANFSFVFKWADVTNKDLERKDMFSVNFQVNIPVAFFTLK